MPGLILRTLCLLAGFGLMLMATVLYPDEEGVIQNRLETSWIVLSDAEVRAVNKHASFVAAVASLADRFYDRLLGQKLFSIRAVGVSACFSLASLLLVCSPGLSTLLLFNISNALYYGLIVALIVLGVLPALFRKRRVQPNEGMLGRKKAWRVILRVFLQVLWLLAVLYLGFLVLMCMDAVNWFNLPRAVGGTELELDLFQINPSAEVRYYLVFIVLTVASDAVFIAVTRWLLRKSSKSDSRMKILGLMTGNVLLASTLVVIPVASAWGFSGVSKLVHSRRQLFNTVILYVASSNPRQTFLSSLGASNMLDGLVAATFFILLFGLLLHRLFWPILQRPTYAFATRGIVKRRKLFFFLGAVMVGFGGMPNSIIKVVSKILETFVSS